MGRETKQFLNQDNLSLSKTLSLQNKDMKQEISSYAQSFGVFNMN